MSTVTEFPVVEELECVLAAMADARWQDAWFHAGELKWFLVESQEHPWHRTLLRYVGMVLTRCEERLRHVNGLTAN